MPDVKILAQAEADGARLLVTQIVDSNHVAFMLSAEGMLLDARLTSEQAVAVAVAILLENHAALMRLAERLGDPEIAQLGLGLLGEAGARALVRQAGDAVGTTH